jgi:hypothetical protein
VVEALVSFVYGRTEEADGGLVPELLRAAHCYQVVRLEEECIRLLIDHMDADAVGGIALVSGLPFFAPAAVCHFGR